MNTSSGTIGAFYRALEKLITLPVSDDKESPNMVNAIMSEPDSFVPEYIQIIQESDGTYWYQHLLPDNHALYERFQIDPHNFHYRSCMPPLQVYLAIDEDNERVE